ncbi:hypothetical protein [Palleronia sp. LCG004]|uniref:hypothetical protein n=1 Tax=Palleronia sp. LCG004 TaxID=3079304 RepID=UPI002942841C|nr:hypothetical protein [Palleronia sp. LCG004]WOI56968.1 hypothetical protein RVY76_04000 [Palleronia sp. LCG004]
MIRDIAGAMTDHTGNLASMPAFFPDQSAPAVRQGKHGRELAKMHIPGDVAYVWHGALHAGTMAERLITTGFEIRAQIVWP